MEPCASEESALGTVTVVVWSLTIGLTRNINSLMQREFPLKY